MSKKISYIFYIQLLFAWLILFTLQNGMGQSVTMYTTGFETGDATPTFSATTGTVTANTNAPYQGTKDASYLAASSALDGSIITSLQSFVAGCTYTVSFYTQVWSASTCSLKVCKSATATNVAMKAATGTDIIMASTNINYGSYLRVTVSFSVLSSESKYIGLQAIGTGSSEQLFIDNLLVTRNCDHCSNGVQDGDETGVDCGGADCPNASPVAGTISPTSASIAAAGSQTLTLTGSTGDIQWQYSNDNSTWYNASGKTSSTYAVTNITATTYYRAKVTYGGCTPTPVYSGTCTLTSTGVTTKTWTGSSSTAWGTSGNWSPSGVPTAANNVVISSGGNQPSIASNINAFCNDLTINTGATLTNNAGGSKVFEISGNIVCNGTLNHASTKLIRLIGVNKTLTGNLTNSNNLIEIDGGSYRLTGTVKIWELTIDNNTNPGCISLGSYTLVVINRLTQNGLIYQETGTLQIEDPQAVLTQGNFIYGTGTTYFGKGENSTAGGQWVVGPFTFYNLKTRNYPSSVCHFGNNQGDITCHNLDIINTGGSAFDGWTHLDNNLIVTNDLTIGAYADLDAEEESGLSWKDITVGGNFINNGRYEQRLNNTTFNGTADQHIQGTATSSFYNLLLSKTSGKVILDANVIIGSNDPQPVKSGAYEEFTTDLNGVLTMGAIIIELNGYKLTFANPNTTAYTRTSGYIKSETNAAVNASIIKWQMGTTTGARVYPFGLTSGGTAYYLPFTFNKTTAGSCDISVSTRATSASDNAPLAGLSNVAAVTSLSNAATDVIDRWWDITPSAAVTANMVFTYRGSENTATSPNGIFGGMHWNGTSWDSPLGSGTGVTTGTGTVSVTDASSFSPWVLSLSAPSSLPVELVSFNAIPKESTVNLDWTTESEINCDYFIVEKSANGKTFTGLEPVKGSGNSTVRRDYHTIDSHPVRGMNYYRLKQVGYNGRVSYSKMVDVNMNRKYELTVVPNPVRTGGMKIILPGTPTASCYLNIIDMNGKIVYEKKISQEFFDYTIVLKDIHFKTTGLYYLNVEIDGTICHEKISVVNE